MLEVVDHWVEKSRLEGIYWVFSGNTREPHLVTQAGEHVNVFFDEERLLRNSVRLYLGTRALLSHLEEKGLERNRVTKVIGVGRRAANLAYTASHLISINYHGVRRGDECLVECMDEPVGMVERRESAPPPEVDKGDKVVLLMTSFEPKSAQHALEAVRRAGAEVMRPVGALANLSDIEEVGRHKVEALIARHVSRWESKEACDLCQMGSEALRPTTKSEWKRLMRR